MWEKYLDNLESKKNKKIMSYSTSYIRNESEDSLTKTYDNSFTT